MDNVIVVLILCVVIGVLINYNSRENMFGTNLISLGLIGYVCVNLFRK